MGVIGRGIIEVTTDTSKAQSGLTTLLSTLGGTDNKTKELQQSFVNLTQTIESQRAKLAHLNEVYDQTKREVERNRGTVDDLAAAKERLKKVTADLGKEESALDKNIAKLTDTKKALITETQRGGQAFEAFGRTVQNLVTHPMQTAQHALEGFMTKIGPVGAGLVAIGSAAAAAGYAINHAAEEIGAYALQVQRGAVITGVNVEQYQALTRASTILGYESSTLTSNLSRMHMQMGRTGGGEFARTLNMLGITTGTLWEKVKAFREQLQLIPDDEKRLDIALGATGRFGRELAIAMVDSNKSLFDLMDRINSSSAVLSKEAIKHTAEQQVKVNELKLVWVGLGHAIEEAAFAIRDFVLASMSTRPGAAMMGGDVSSVQAAQLITRTRPSYQYRAPTFEEAMGEEGIAPSAEGPDVRLKAQRDRVERMNALMAGAAKQNMDLLVKLKAAQQDYADAVKLGLIDEAEQRFHVIMKLQEELKLREEGQKKAKEAAAEQERMYAAGIAFTRQWATAHQKALDIWDATSKSLNDMVKDLDKARVAVEDWRTPLEALARDKAAWDKWLKPEEGDKSFTTFLNRNRKTAEDVAKIWQRQISDIVTTWSRGMVDMVFSTESMAKKVVSMLLDTSKAILRMVLEMAVGPLQGKLSGWLGGVLGGVTPALAGTSASGGVLNIAELGFPFAGAATGTSTAALAGSSSAAGALSSAAAGGAALVGTAMVGSAVGSGSKLMGAAGGGLAGAGVGFMLGSKIGMFAGPLGIAIGAGIGAGIGLLVAALSGGEKRRAESLAAGERAREPFIVNAPSPLTRTMGFAIGGDMDVQTGLTGRVQAYRQDVVVNMTVEAMDVADFESRTGAITKAISRAIMSGGSQLADNLAYMAG